MSSAGASCVDDNPFASLMRMCTQHICLAGASNSDTSNLFNACLFPSNLFSGFVLVVLHFNFSQILHNLHVVCYCKAQFIGFVTAPRFPFTIVQTTAAASPDHIHIIASVLCSLNN